MSRCDNCLFGDDCDVRRRTRCDDYSPIETESYINKLIEKERNEFRQEWFKYISLYDD